ncbi:hypothetical protein A6E13_11290 [Aliivibrio fischeri]|uniref:hypothetical protein n=1 Tax=Aliivibrio fischeri TaxID=668 RepID=UPI00080ED1D3|nr:hypothetical protein [Aliivibrio fischeri]OCH32989.1 hypothetical protein A6E13_11290 [Aliivibrio fischeri]
MKRITKKQRAIDVRNSLKHRKKPKQRKKPYIGTPLNKVPRSEYKPVNEYIDEMSKKGLSVEHNKNKKNGITIYLPEKMDFEQNHHLTMLHIEAISKLVGLINKNGGRTLSRGAYNLGSVNFDSLKCISTEAALVLTSEISNWEDSIRNKLRPKITKWDDSVYSQFHDLGFFDLFANKPLRKPTVNSHASDKKLVKYQKGSCNVKGTTKTLRKNIHEIVGDDIEEWTFLHSGLDEAITNVIHHAYPDDCETRPKEKCWYLTASFHKTTKQLKVTFFDQGVGIPRTLETSKLKEKIFKYTSKFIDTRRKLDETLLEAAIEVGRTRTGESDRGNGLPDLLEFIRQRGNGELSILSAYGRYQFIAKDKNEDQKSSRLSIAMPGTLIVWQVIL